jgi:RimJ/RimL family protein N-acetyltransferase
MTVAGRVLLRAVKNVTLANTPALTIPLGKPVRALLRPIATLPGATDPTDIHLLSEWRNRHVASFLSEFVANDVRTERWLTGSVHPNDGKLLFMLDALDGTRLGHLGLGFIDWGTAYGEADAIVSGGASPPGLMKLALQTLLWWASTSLGLKKLAVRVRSDNTAIAFYEKVGFHEWQRVPLVARRHDDGTLWVEDLGLGSGDGPCLVYMWYGST